MAAGKVTLYVEGINSSNALGATRILVQTEDPNQPEGCNAEDAIRLSVVDVDLDIDSDNTDAFNAPERNAKEDQLEDNPTKPGRYVLTNGSDKDEDGVIDFADGYNLDGTAGNDDDQNTLEKFVPVVLELPMPIDLTKAKLQVTYDASDPAGVTVTGTPPDATYTPAAGSLRIWTKPGDAARNKAAVKDSGDYLKPDTYTAAELGLSGTTRSVTLYVENVLRSNDPGDRRILIKLDPDDAGPAGFLAEDAVRTTGLTSSALVDTNRDAAVDQKDEHKKDKWSKTRGAFFITNYDDDDTDLKSDAIQFDDEGNPIDEDTDIEATDVSDIGHLIVKATGVKDNLQFFLRMDADDLKAVHIFEERQASKPKVWGGWGDHNGDMGVQVKDITAQVKKDADVDLGIESLFLRGQKHDLPAGGTYEFDGEVDVELVVQNTVGEPGIVPAKVLGTSKVHLKVAPYLLLPNTRDGQKVWMDANALTNDIAAKFGALARRAVPTVNQWFQDHVQIGYTSMPGEEMHLTVRMPYGGQDQWPIANLLGADSGLFRFRDTVTHDGSNSGDFGGNLEVVPYSDEYLLGRILIGNTMKTKLADFLTAQEVQNPFSVDVNWLAVGHVDEIVGFAPGGTRGYKVVHASPDYAQQLLTVGDPGRGIAPPADSAAVFLADGAKEGNGTSSTVIATSGRVYVFDGVAHGLIKVVAAANLVDGELVSIHDGAGRKRFEFDNNGIVGGGNVQVDISTAVTATDVRDRLITAINGVAGFKVDAYADSPDQMVLIHEDFGAGSNQGITETVANGGFTVQGMAGGEAAANGRDFTLETWQYIRLHKGTGAGQVGEISERHKGWVKVNRVFNTTSLVAYDTNNPGAKSLYYYLATSDLTPTRARWFTESDNTTEYIVATDTRKWNDNGRNVPALISVFELKNDATLWQVNAAAQAKVATAKTTIQTAMGAATGGGSYLREDGNDADDSLGGDADDDFIFVPVIYMGYIDGATGVLEDRNTVAYTPGLANFQPANAGLMVFPKQFGPRSGGNDVLEQANTAIIGAAASYADDWDLYHRLDGEVHCATEVVRDFFAFNWWEKQP